MKRTLLFVFALVITQMISAQSFAPTGARWNYTYSNFWVFGYVELESVSDTIVNGLDCKKLSKTRETFNYMTDEFLTENLSFEIISSDEDKVYIFRNGQFYTLYDFSADINDTWEIPMTYENLEQGCDTLGTVQIIAKGDTLIEDQNLRYIVIEPIENSAWALRGLVIENIGAVEYYLLPEQECIVDFFEGGLFRCYNDEIFDLHDGPYPCWYITLGLNQTDSKSELSAYPNPSKNYLNIDIVDAVSNSSIQVFNLNGQLVLSEELNSNTNRINVSDFPNGLYYIHQLDDVGNIIAKSKFMKI